MGLAVSEYHKEYYRKNKDKLRAKGKAWYERNKESVLAKQRQYYLANKERISARSKAYSAANSASIAAYNQTPERRAAVAKYRDANKEKLRRDAAERRAANPGHAYAIQKRYVERHPEVKALWDAQRLARKRGAVGSHTVAEWEEKKAEYAHRCAYCGGGGPLTRDHDVPLAAGGTHHIGNIVPACRRCNSQKRAMPGREYRERFHGSRA